MCVCVVIRKDLSLFGLLFASLALLIGGGVLVLLVLRHQIVHVGLGLSEFHLVHALASVPMQESLATEHSSELFAHTLEQLLDGRRVANESGAHLQTSWRDIANGGLHVVGDPFNEVRGVLVLYVQHLLVHFFHGHAATENGGYGQITAVAGIACGHHVLGIEHLLGELGHGQCTVLLRATRCQWGEAGHEKVETRKRHHVDGQLSQISVQLTWKSEASGHSRHGG